MNYNTTIAAKSYFKYPIAAKSYFKGLLKLDKRENQHIQIYVKIALTLSSV